MRARATLLGALPGPGPATPIGSNRRLPCEHEIGATRRGAPPIFGRAPTRQSVSIPSVLPTGDRTAAALPGALYLVLVATFLPEALSFYIAGLRLTVIRLIFLAFTPFLAFRLLQQVAAGRYRFVPSDIVVPLTGVWMFLAPAASQDLQAALAHSGPVVLEFCGAYWTMRLLLTRHGEAITATSFLCGVIAVVAVLGILDPLLDQYFVHYWSNTLTGYGKPLPRGLERRLGLLRGMGPLEHPILFGTACSVGLLLAAFTAVKTRRLKLLICGAGVFFSFSAAPIMGAILGCGLLLYDRVLVGIGCRWRALSSLLGGGAALLFLLHSAPFGFILRHLVLFDQGSGYDRLLQWQVTGGFLLQFSPWFGLGFEPIPDHLRFQMFSMSGSIDALWLNMALYCGIPGSILIGLSVITSMCLSTRSRGVRLQPDEARLGTAISVVLCAMIFVGFTTHFWGIDWVLFALLMGMRAHLSAFGRSTATAVLRVSNNANVQMPLRSSSDLVPLGVRTARGLVV